MTNTEYLYQAIKRFTETRSKARSEFLDVVEKYADAKGSKYYTDRMSEAHKARNEALDKAAAECRHSVDCAVASMQLAIQKRRMEPPTEEQLRILSLLKMRDKLTQAELDTAANAMDGNGAALAVLSELAQKNGVLGRNYGAKATQGLSGEAAMLALKGIVDSCRQIINNRSGANHNRLRSAQMNERLHGAMFDPDSLPQEARYASESDFYGRICDTPYEVLCRSLNE